MEENHYYPFGIKMDGPWLQRQNTGLADRYNYNGKEEMPWTGYLYYGARVYDAGIARFSSVDPISDQFPHVSVFNYAENRPIAGIDLHGLQFMFFHKAKSFQDHVDYNVSAYKSLASNLFESARVMVDPVKTIESVSGLVDVILDPIGSAKTMYNNAVTTLQNTQSLDPVVAGDAAGDVAAVGVEAAIGSKGLGKLKSISKTKKAPVTNELYKRPNNATTKSQRAFVQGKPCVKCGAEGQKNYAGHKKALVQEHYETGTIDKQKMRSLEAIQPECPTCSSREGADMSRYSQEMKVIIENRTQTNNGG